MHISFPSHYMNGVQYQTREDHYPTSKSDADCNLTSDYRYYWRLYLVMWIQNWRRGPWCFCCRQFCFRIHIWWIIYILWQTWILSRACDETYQFPLLIVFRWTEKILGPSTEIYLMKIMWDCNSIITHGWNLTEGHIITGVGKWII